MKDQSKIMNEKYRSVIMNKIVQSLWVVLNMVFASSYCVIEVDGESGGFEDEDTYMIRLGIGTTTESIVLLNEDNEFDNYIIATNDFIKKLYNTEPTKLFNGPQSSIIGIPRDVVDCVKITCEKYDQIPYMVLNDIILGDDNKYHLQSTGNIPNDLKGYCIEIQLKRDDIKDMKQFSDERVFNYLAFYLFTWICMNPNFNFNEDEFKRRINTLLGGESNEADVIDKEEKEGSKTDI